MQKDKKSLRRRGLVIVALVIVIAIIKIFSNNLSWVENLYAEKFYNIFSSLLRSVFGWLPFSVGDIIYCVAISWLIWKFCRFFFKLFKKQINKKCVLNTGYQMLIISMIIYIIFNIFWGINYNRQPIAKQLNLQIEKPDSQNLKFIEILLVKKLNESKQVLIKQRASYPTNKELFKRAFACYRETNKAFSFLDYKHTSVKSSMFGRLGNYFGFTGYYNPFTGEAQMNTTVPKFILPYTTTHEMAHQLGYAKEEEANFGGYLAATSSTDTLFHYSAYFDLFLYANSKLYFVDSNFTKSAVAQLIPEVKADIKEWRSFLVEHKNPLEPIIRWAYGNYLRANHQPKGMGSYDEVIADLIAFYKKYGKI